MPSNFGTLFTYSGPAGQDGFYKILAPCENSMNCHQAMLELFMNALKLSSIRYRTGSFPSPSPIPSIDSEAKLNDLLQIIPEDLQDPLSQVMYEQYEVDSDTGTIGNNAWYIKTYADAATKATLQTSVDQVRSYNYALFYNELLGEYGTKGWAGIPAAIPLTTPQSPPGKAAVLAAIATLATWIRASDPKLVALTILRAKTAVQILNDLYGAVPLADVSTILFTRALVKQIQSSGGTQVTATRKHAKTVFFEEVQAALGNAASIWQTTASLKKLADQIRANPPSEINKTPSEVLITFSQVIEVFDMALSDATTTAHAKTDILNILTSINGKTTSTPDYLLTQLQNTCDILKVALNPDPLTLDAWVVEINEEIPTTVHYSDIDGLMELVLDQITQIPLTYSGAAVSFYGFSNYDDIKFKDRIVNIPGGNPATTDTITVSADAAENGTAYSRPIFGVFTKGAQNETYLKFFNISPIPNGTFYFTDPKNPQQVNQNFFPTADPATTLTFNFSLVTINGLKKVPAGGIGPYPEGRSYKKVTASGSTSKQVFFDCIRTLSKWKSLEGKLKYDVLYQTSVSPSDAVSITTHLIWYISSGDLTRTDNVDDSLCFWAWLAPTEIKAAYPQIPSLIGLPPERNLDRCSSVAFIQANLNENPADASPPVQLFVNRDPGPSSGIYVLTNSPSSRLPADIDKVLDRDSSSAGASAPLAEQARKMSYFFNFRYYRKIDLEAGKVIKWLPASNKPNTLADGIDLTAKYRRDLPEGYDQVIGIETPISFNLLSNIAFFKSYTAPNATAGISLKNKGNDLFRARGKRLAAGSVMAKLRNYINVTPKPGSNTSLSASQMSNWEIAESNKAREAWQGLKKTRRDRLPTDQEWCHLLGHGDGGDERFGNFVSGSFHCNTEQLAMESKGRRQVTQSEPKGTYTLRSTAYLFNDGENLLSSNYLNNDRAYAQMKKVYAALSKPKAGPTLPDKSGTVLPFAAFLRYKMYVNPSIGDAAGAPTRASFQKLFDYIFEGQSEFIDQHQFAIIKYASWFCLAGEDAFKAWYVEQTATAVAGDAAE